MNHLKAFGAVVIFSILILLICNHFFKISLFETKDSVQSIKASLYKVESNLIGYQFKNINDETINFDDLQGKIVIINFWASWCSPCIEEVPSLLKLINEFDGKIVLIAISGDSQINDVNVFLKSFPEMRNKNIHIVFDESKKNMNSFGVERLPESFVVNSKMKIVKKIVGSIDWYTVDSKDYIEELLKY